MAHKGPHISISPDYVVNRILRINIDDFAEWPESVRHLAIAIAEELFLVAYNPFINVETVRNSVHARFERESMALAHYFANAIGEGITMFWSAYEAERSFREELISALRNILPNECILSSPSALVASATDATDLRMELPLLVVEPDSAEQVAALVKLANDMKFALIPRGGGSGMTGGAVPARKRTVIVSLTRLTKIGPIDLENMTVTVEAGAITQNVIKAVDAAGALFSVDPASKQASSIGGNVSENAGGPSAFEYGTTLDNLLWWRMVTPTGEIISVERENHPRHKILPEETAVFVVKDISGGVRNVIHLRGDEIRLPGLGKDVTNKALGGLPGMQKEGVDGIITEACFIIHPKPKFKRVMVLEFFGRSMHPAAVVVRELVGLRNRIRQEGDYAHLSALEEFNAKYVQAIEYKRKSQKYEGLPISVIILQVDGDDPYLLDKCVNDIVCCGARPLFFLDYIACGKNVPERIEAIVSGVADGCRQAGCAIVGGETAEMPGFYPENEYDLAGFAVGIVDRARILDKARVAPGDALIALPSSGVHSNGFSLVRRVFDEAALSGPLGAALLTPTRIYVKPVLALMDAVPVKSVAHITGGGFYENIPRALPGGVAARIERAAVRTPELFDRIAAEGGIPERDMFNTFNMGVGMCVCVAASDADRAIETLRAAGEDAYLLGETVSGEGVELC